LSAIQETADARVADPYIYAQALAGRLSASAAARMAIVAMGEVMSGLARWQDIWLGP
jgi:hypothetical protein